MNDKKKYLSKLTRILTREEMGRFLVDTDSLIDTGYKYLESEEFKKAFIIFSMIIRINGIDPDSLNGLGVALCELGRLKTSKTVLEKTVELYPDDAITLANIAGVYWDEGEIEKAIYYYSRSLDYDQSITETHLNLINLYYEQGCLFNAYIACLNLLNIFPDNIQAKETRDDLIIDLGICIY
ncbi:MAG: tetratricopeptide repeat protein [Spirochaetes bacterium]|nr:tetratricopeptide repeat protein [Spirochaetota bacterium]